MGMILVLIILLEIVVIMYINSEKQYWKRVAKNRKDIMNSLWNEEGKEEKE